MVDVRKQGDSFLFSIDKKNFVTIEIKKLIKTVTEKTNKYVAESILQEIGINYDAGD